MVPGASIAHCAALGITTRRQKLTRARYAQKVVQPVSVEQLCARTVGLESTPTRKVLHCAGIVQRGRLNLNLLAHSASLAPLVGLPMGMKGTLDFFARSVLSITGVIARDADIALNVRLWSTQMEQERPRLANA